MKFLVVGAGIAGSSFARHAREAGHEATIIANPDKQCSSRAALCVVKPSWFKDEYRRECEWSLAYYRKHGWITSEEAEYSTHLRPGKEIRDGYYSVHPTMPLLQPNLLGDWTADSDMNAAYDHVVVCRGAYSDLPWKRSWGSTSVYQERTQQIARAYNDRPRSVIFSCSHDGMESRFGSSRAKDAQAALAKQMYDETKAFNAGFLPVERPHHWETGVRLMPPTLQDAGQVRKLNDRLTAVEGFGRVGYSLAPARTYELLARLTA